MTRIDPSLYLKNQQTQGAGSNILDKDDFLKILMTQIQNQNPLDPMKDKEFISQMTQFSSLEQMTNMSQSFQEFMDNQSMPPLIQYSGLIGKEVSFPLGGQETGVGKGIVQSVIQKEGHTVLELESGSSVSVEDISKVSNLEKDE